MQNLIQYLFMIFTRQWRLVDKEPRFFASSAQRGNSRIADSKEKRHSGWRWCSFELLLTLSFLCDLMTCFSVLFNLKYAFDNLCMCTCSCNLIQPRSLTTDETHFAQIWTTCTQASTMRPHKSAHFILLNLIPLIAWENNLAQLGSLHLPLCCTKPWNYVWHPAIYHTDAEWWKGKKRRSVTQEEMELIQCHSKAPALQWHTDRAPLNALCRSSPLCSLHSYSPRILCCHFQIHGGCTTDSPGPCTWKRPVMQHSHLVHMQIPTTCTHRLLLRKNIYYITMSVQFLPKLTTQSKCRL